MSHVGMSRGRSTGTGGTTYGNSNSGESARTCVHCELPENLVRYQHSIDLFDFFSDFVDKIVIW